MRFLMSTILLLACCNQLFSGDWYQFLGSDRNGISSETDLADRFPDAGPEIAWRTPLGVGMSNLAIKDGVAYTMYQDAKHQYAVAIDAMTGEKKWQASIAPFYKNAMGNGPRATPTIHGKDLFVYTGEGVLVSLAIETGKLNWKVDTAKQFKAKPPEYGASCSPLIASEGVVIQTSAANGCVASFDLSSGKLRWITGKGACGYSSPVILNLDGNIQIVAFTGTEVLGLDTVTGKQLWSYPYVTEFHCNTASPVQTGRATFLVSAGENHGSTILELKADAKTFRVEPTWKSLGKASVLRAEWQTPIAIDGHLFALDNVGSAGPITNLVCIRLSDGAQVWNEKRFGKSNLTYANGKLFISTMEGELVIVKASTKEFTELARAKILGMTRQAPVICNGFLYLRDNKEVVCVDIRAKK